MRITHPQPAPYMGRCNYCGLHWGSTHSGSYECTLCWDHRKLNRPAAAHWRRVLLPVFSNIDMNDSMYYFPAAGHDLSVLNPIHELLIYSLLLLRHGPIHRWDNETYRMIWAAEDNGDLLDTLLTDEDREILRKAA